MLQETFAGKKQARAYPSTALASIDGDRDGADSGIADPSNALRWQLLAMFFGIMIIGTIIVGYIFNGIL